MTFALKTENVDAVNALIRNGVDVNCPTGGGVSPLYIALQTGNLILMEILIIAGAIVDFQNPYGTTVLLKVMAFLFSYCFISGL